MASPADPDPAAPQGATEPLDPFQLQFVRAAGILLAVGSVVGALSALAADQPVRVLSAAPFGLVGLAALWLHLAGHRLGAARILVLGSWLAAINGMLWSNGLLSPGSVSIFCLVLLFSGWFLGSRTAVVLTVLTPIALFVVAWGTEAGWPLPLAHSSRPLHLAPVLAIVSVVAGALGYYASRSLRLRLEELRRSQEALAEKVDQLSRREAELEGLRRRYEAFFRLGPTASAVAVPGDGTILECNDAFAELLGRPREEILGRSSLALGYWRDLADRDRAYAILDREGTLRDFETTWLRADGSERRCLVAWERVTVDGEQRLISEVADITRLRRAEEASLALEEMFAAAFRSTPDAIVFTRLADRAIVEVNPAFERLTGWAREEILGRTGTDLGLWRDPADRARLLGAVMAGQTVADASFGSSHRDGTPLECRYFGTRVTLGGEPHVMSIVRDVTAEARANVELAESRRELAESNRSLRRQVSLHEFTEHVARVGHWLTDRARGTVTWSRALFEISGVPPRGPMGVEEAAALVDIAEKDQLRLAQQRLDGTPAYYHFTWPDGRVRWVRASLARSPEPGPGADEYFGVVQDVTEEHEAKLALERLNAELELRVAERTAELQDALAELDAFAYSVAHDLNAPLRAIDGFAAMLEMDAAGRLEPGERRDLARIRRSATQMASLIADLLRLSRVSRATVDRRPVDLTSLAAEIAAELASAQPGRRVQWRIAPGLRASADAGLARSLLQNLLGNAWKYTRDTPEPVIEFAADGPDAFVVRDNGAGFEMAHASRLFAPFQRLHGEEFEGTGIGLATVDRIVRRHGGLVTAEGRLGAGATFRFTLPPA